MCLAPTHHGGGFGGPKTAFWHCQDVTSDSATQATPWGEKLGDEARLTLLNKGLVKADKCGDEEANVNQPVVATNKTDDKTATTDNGGATPANSNADTTAKGSLRGSRKLLFGGLFGGSGKTEASATCTPTPGLCSGTCTIAENVPAKGSDLHISVHGSCPNTTVTAATYNIKIAQKSLFGELPVLERKDQDASKDNKFDLPLSMGSVELPAVKFPVAAGKSLDISSVANIASYAPSGTVISTVTAFDQNGGQLFSFQIQIKM
jgi:hypothetical protein